MKINIIDIIPNEILPRYGDNKRKLNIKQEGNFYVLTSKRCRKKIRIPSMVDITDKDLIAIGLYLAEGKKEKPHKNKNSNHSGEIAFDSSDVNSINLVCNLLRKLGINRREFRTSLDLNINYKDHLTEDQLSGYWMTRLKLNPHYKRKVWLRYKGTKGGRLNKNSSPYGCIKVAFASVIFRNIFIPFVENFFKEAIHKKDKQAISLILQGYFAGDGHVSYAKSKGHRKHVEFLCNDFKLRSLLKEALSILGINNLKETYPSITKTHTYALRIYNRPDFLVLNRYKILDFMGYKKEIFSNLLNQYKRNTIL